jgi:hypothetical protein
MLRLAFIAATLLVASSGSLAANCDTIRSQIEAKIRASGVANFTLSTVEADARTTGRVVGTCDFGTKKIVYVASSAPASSGAKPRSANESIITECKDGSVSIGGECKK